MLLIRLLHDGSQSNLTDEALIKIINELDLITKSALEPSQRDQLRRFLFKYRNVFAAQPLTPGRSSEHDFSSNRHGWCTAHPPPCIPHLAFRKSFVKEQLDMNLDAGIVLTSNSPWAAPVVIVKKNNNKLRFCVDYRGLNKLTVRDSYPLPRIDDTLDRLSGARFFTTLDAASGYWQVPLHPPDQHKTTFITHRGLYEWTVMPFGLVNALQRFKKWWICCWLACIGNFALHT